ncbi:uncharacterized protein LOC133816262 [Humulus lupulus]|uniref:uncharacterized protein LOC133816262 n=1 Tax=Humulus lupulus TaxID=3486 RepID=UPI002B405070|nr:uncharacterized protein LOC133816262 [Humulus lupulus]
MQFLARLDQDKIPRVFMLLWAVWFRRNEWVWRNKQGSCFGISLMAESSLQAWVQAQDRSIAPLHHFLSPEDGRESWSKPPLGYLKVNVDAANFKEASTFSFAGVARNHEGVLMEAFSVCRMGSVSPELGEAMGVREALSWIKRKNWVQVLLETDSILVVQALRSSCSLPSYFGRVIDECKELLNNMSSVLINFVKRSANGAAHALAKESSFVAERSLFQEDMSSLVLDVLIKDCC